MLYEINTINLKTRRVRNPSHHQWPDGSTSFGVKVGSEQGNFKIVETTSITVGTPSRYARKTEEITTDGDTVVITTTYAWKPLADIKTHRIEQAKKQAGALLSQDDWRSLREREEPGKPMAASMKTYRNGIRDASDAFETAINATSSEIDAIDVAITWPVDPLGRDII